MNSGTKARMKFYFDYCRKRQAHVKLHKRLLEIEKELLHLAKGTEPLIQLSAQERAAMLEKQETNAIIAMKKFIMMTHQLWTIATIRMVFFTCLYVLRIRNLGR